VCLCVCVSVRLSLCVTVCLCVCLSRCGTVTDAVARFEAALLKARRAVASRDFDEFFVTLDLNECLTMQADAFDALCMVRLCACPPLSLSRLSLCLSL
jgi:hypothetical protein